MGMSEEKDRGGVGRGAHTEKQHTASNRGREAPRQRPGCCMVTLSQKLELHSEVWIDPSLPGSAPAALCGLCLSPGSQCVWSLYGGVCEV